MPHNPLDEPVRFVNRSSVEVETDGIWQMCFHTVLDL